MIKLTVSLENEFLRVSFSKDGGELTSIFNKKNNTEYLWQADSKFWGRHAPVLFPIVGRLKNDTYRVNGVDYQLSQHGFARDLEFNIELLESNQVLFSLHSNQETLKKYPFDFVLKIKYHLSESKLRVTYIVENPSTKTLLFSIGGHPAFNVPIQNTELFEDYHVTINPKDNYPQIKLQGNYSDSKNPHDFTKEQLHITRETFENDAVILSLKDKHPMLTLTDKKNKKGIHFNTGNADFVGIWSKYPEEAPFVCIEPWWGLADDITTDGELAQKVGIHKLTEKEVFSGFYEIEVF